MKKILAFVVALAAFSGCLKADNSMYIPAYGEGKSEKPDKGSDVDDTIEQDVVADGDLKVISFNVRVKTTEKNEENDWDNRKYAIPDIIYKENPTVFGVQEALQVQLTYIRSQCPDYEDVGVGRDDGQNGGEHMNIFYNTKRVKLENWGRFWLSETPDTPSYGWGESYRRLAVWAMFTDLATSKKFFYMNTHGPLSQDANKFALELIARQMKVLNPDGYPAILTGDFNIKADNSNFEVIRKLPMYNANEIDNNRDKLRSGIDTYNGWGNGNGIIDFIWYSDFSEVKEYRVINEVYRKIRYASDHYPITATLVLTPSGTDSGSGSDSGSEL